MICIDPEWASSFHLMILKRRQNIIIINDISVCVQKILQFLRKWGDHFHTLQNNCAYIVLLRLTRKRRINFNQQKTFEKFVT